MTSKYFAVIDVDGFRSSALRAKFKTWKFLPGIVGFDNLDDITGIDFVKSVTTNSSLVATNFTSLSYPDETTAKDDVFSLIEQTGHSFSTYDGLTYYTKATVDELSASVATISEDSYYPVTSRVLPLDKVNWGLQRIMARPNVKDFKVNTLKSGKNVDVYIFDAGIQMNHPEIETNTAQIAYDAFRTLGDSEYGYPDGNDHGTHVAAIVGGINVGVAPNSTLISVKVLSDIHASTLGTMIDAVDWMLAQKQTRNRASIANFSFVSEDPNSKEIFELLFSTMISEGIVPVVSAGNQGKDAYYISPANAGSTRFVFTGTDQHFLNTTHDDNVKPIVVAASTINDEPFGPSNHGDVIDIFAPGQNIFSASNTGYTVKSGTSMAAPFVTGVISMMLEDETLTTGEVRNKLISTSTKFIFDEDSLVNERENYTIFDDVMGEVSIANKLVTPNRLLFAWYVPTEFEWPEISLEMDENTRLSNTFDITSNYNNIYEITSYTVIPYTQINPVELKVFAGYNDEGNIGTYKNFITPLEMSALSLPVIDDVVSTFIIEAYDGRLTSFGKAKILVKNVAVPPVWVNPVSGILAASPLKKNMSFGVNEISFEAIHEDGLDIVYSVYPENALPSGLTLTQVGNIASIIGTVAYIPPNEPLYEFIVRATASNGLIADRYFAFTSEYSNELHRFNPVWLSSLIPDMDYPNVLVLKTGGIGNSYLTPIEIINPDADPLTFEVSDVVGIVEDDEHFNGELPIRLYVDEEHILRGIVDPSVAKGRYYFKLIVREPSGYAIEQDFVLPLIEELSDIDDGEQIEWITPSGNIGWIYETFPSHCRVEARSPTNSPIVYSLTPGSGTLPAGLFIDGQTGDINGVAAMVEGNTTYTFSIRASVAQRYVDRSFSIRIIDIYKEDEIMTVKANMTGFQRLDVGSYTWGGAITQSYVFKKNDKNFGGNTQQNLYVVSGVVPKTDQEIMDSLQEYEKKVNLVIQDINYKEVKDPSGLHVYDVIYLNLKDPLEKAGGMPTPAIEDVLLKFQKNTSDPNNYDDITEQTRYFPNSMRNIRNDVIRDFGLVGPKEGMPLWMNSTYTLGITVMYIKAGFGFQALEELRKHGFVKEFTGKLFEVDRFLISELATKITTQFDVVDGEATTVFDDPNKPAMNNVDLSMYDQPTQFDVLMVESGKYYKFPLDNLANIERLIDNPYRFK